MSVAAVFGSYARYYDLLYRDKDYAGEAAFVARQLRARAQPVERILELGSGTGSHALELARMGFAVAGVDLSAEMVARARARGATLPPELASRLEFREGDARSVRLGGSFDAVVSLFHVVSYQVADADLSAMLETARAHLSTGGLLFFDYWYGPAVVAQKPEAREKRLQDDELDVIRTAEPQHAEAQRRVDVRFTVRATRRRGGEPLPEVVETHRMRYYYLPELERALERAGFQALSSSEMGTGAALDATTWSASLLARAS